MRRVITCAGAGLCLAAPARPISTPTPIASSSTPTPAITVSVVLRCGGPPVGALPGGIGGVGGTLGADDGAWALPDSGGSPVSTLLIGTRRAPHSRQ